MYEKNVKTIDRKLLTGELGKKKQYTYKEENGGWNSRNTTSIIDKGMKKGREQRLS